MRSRFASGSCNPPWPRPQAPLRPRLASGSANRAARPVTDARLSLDPPKLLSAHERVQTPRLKVSRMVDHEGS